MNQHQDSGLSGTIKTQASRYAAPKALRDRIGADLVRADRFATASFGQRFWAGLSNRWLGMGAAFACGAIASLTLTLFYLPPDDEDRLSQEVVAGHVRSLMLAHLSDVASSEQHTVKPWFSGKLDFSPPVHDLASEGFPLVGGRLDYLNQRPVAALVYRRQQHTINVFVWPASGTAPRHMKSLSRQGFHMTDWADSGMQFWAVSDLNPAEMQDFTRLLRQQIKD